MFEVLDEACTPTKGTEFSACVDLYAREDLVIGAGETVLVPLGVKIDKLKLMTNVTEQYNYNIFASFSDFAKRHQLNLHIRSSMSAKHGLVIANGTGIIDLDYPGEIMICLQNNISDAHITTTYLESGEEIDSFVKFVGQNKKDTYGVVNIKRGDKIAQISLVEHKTYLLGIESEGKRTGGFGSTDA